MSTALQMVKYIINFQREDKFNTYYPAKFEKFENIDTFSGYNPYFNNYNQSHVFPCLIIEE